MGKNYSFTCNNPTESLTDWFRKFEVDTTYARAQAEKGENGTLHFQACCGFKKDRRINSVIKDFPGCHVEATRNAMAAWNYCGKSDTRIEGPVESGVPPAARNVKGDKAE